MTSSTVAGVHRITVPTPFEVGPVNLYLLVEAEMLTLVDTGPLTQEAEHALEQGLQALGYRVEDVRQIVLTHFHVDHTGMLERLVERSGATVYAHPLTAPLIALDSEVDAARHRFFTELYASMGVPIELIEQGLNQLTDYHQFSGRGQVDVVLQEGERLPGHDKWDVIYTPGHSQDHLSLYRAEDRVMLLGDHLIDKISSNALTEPPAKPGMPRPKTLVIYREALRKIQALPWEIGFSGHGNPIMGGQALIEERLRNGEQRAAKIVEWVRQGKRTCMEVALAMFPRHLSQIPLILSETLGHLDWMVEEGVLAAEQNAGGIWEYRTTEKSLFLEGRGE